MRLFPIFAGILEAIFLLNGLLNNALGPLRLAMASVFFLQPPPNKAIC
jgi:hypothetical protein